MNNGWLKHPKVGMSVRESGPHGINKGNDPTLPMAVHGRAAIDRVMVARDERRPGDGRGDQVKTQGPIV